MTSLDFFQNQIKYKYSDGIIGFSVVEEKKKEKEKKVSKEALVYDVFSKYHS